MKTTASSRKGGSSQDRRRARRAAERETLAAAAPKTVVVAVRPPDDPTDWTAADAASVFRRVGFSDVDLDRIDEIAISACARAWAELGPEGTAEEFAELYERERVALGGKVEPDEPILEAEESSHQIFPVEDPGEALGAKMASEFMALGARARGETPRSAAARRRAALEALVAAGDAPADSALTTIEATNCSDAERYWRNAVIHAGYLELGSDRWPVEEAALEESDGVVFRDGDSEAVLRLGDGTLVLASCSWGWMRVRLAAPSRDGIADVFSAFRSRYPASYVSNIDDGRVPITFWMNSAHGPIPHLRRIESASWTEVEPNYSAAVRDELGSLMAWERPGAEGQLFLWQGPPGTGKTWALRALASEWADWAEFHYITDPDSFFVKDSSYMVSVLLADSYDAIDAASGNLYSETDEGGKWRVLILEDTGELLAANAKESYGQGLSRLLNVVDGMIGQGLRVLALVTTNDELGDLHPAVVRPGRCASQLTFGPLSPEEVVARCGLDGFPIPEEGLTIAEVYARYGEETAEALQEDASEETEDDAAPGMPCAACDHTYAMHPDGGACAADGCGCTSFDAGEEAAAEVASARFEVRLRAEALDRLRAADAEALATWRFEMTDFEVVPGSEVELEPAAPISLGVRWRAVLCPEGSPTDDGRIFAPGSITWRDLPLSLMGLIKTSALGGHDQAELAGRIDNVWRDGSLIRAEGVFDEGEFGQKIAALVGDGDLRGVSVDLAVSKYEVAYRSDVLDEDGRWIGGDAPGEAEADPWDVMVDGEEADLMLVVWEAKIGMATVCPFQAFEPATIEIAASLAAGGVPNPMLWRFSHQAGWVVTAAAPSDEAVDMAADRDALVERSHPGYGRPLHGVEAPADGTETLLASAGNLAAKLTLLPIPGPGRKFPGVVERAVVDAMLAAASDAPVRPPASWFADPELDGPTPLTITDDGRIFGHAAAWDSCHMSYADVCVAPPTTETGYAYFLLGELETDEGDLIPVGKITLDTGHAGRTLGRTATTRHYDDTGTVVAHVAAGEDEHGIWFAGALVPGLEEDKVRILRAASLSGDWRDVSGNLELVALLTVNVPGFPVPRPRALVSASDAGRRVLALTAAGVVRRDGEEPILSPRLAAQFGALRLAASGDWAALRARALDGKE